VTVKLRLGKCFDRFSVHILPVITALYLVRFRATSGTPEWAHLGGPPWPGAPNLEMGLKSR
jgi:hypothetical protein